MKITRRIFHGLAYKVHSTTAASMKQRLPSGQLLVNLEALKKIEEEEVIEDDVTEETARATIPHDLVSRNNMWNAREFKSSILERATISIHDSNTIEIGKRIRDFGFALVKDLQDPVETFVQSLTSHPPRSTNYGNVYEVRQVAQVNNLADSSRALSPHTDNPYRDSVPSLQIIHCIEADSEGGGDSILVDGFAVSSDLSEESFRALTCLPARFRYIDHEKREVLQSTRHVLESSMITTNENFSKIRRVYFNDRSIVGPCALLDLKEQNSFWNAFTEFRKSSSNDRFMGTFRLSPGDCLLLNNNRVLHGRTALGASSGNRLLRGCYSDVESILAKLSYEESY